MPTRAMIIVGGGSAGRFGEDKLMTNVAGRPLVTHTVAAVAPSVDICVLVCREDQLLALSSLDLEAVVVAGGSTRTESERAGLTALGGDADLIGIHDGARPLLDPALTDRLFAKAEKVGGAVPVLEPDQLLVTRKQLEPVVHAVVVQTPQVFRGPDLFAAYVGAARAQARWHGARPSGGLRGPAGLRERTRHTRGRRAPKSRESGWANGWRR